MKMQSIKRGLQRGFTLVELAIVLVIAGIILVAVLKGTDAINKAKVERMVSDLRGLQGTLLEFQKRTGRYAGDCDNNGLLLNTTLPMTTTLLPGFANSTGTGVVLDMVEANRIMPGTPVMGVGTANSTCISTLAAATTAENDINLAWNELRRAGVVDANRLPRELARHGFNDVFAIGSMRDTTALGGQVAGIIVVYGIPVWMAEAIDASIDGQATTYAGAALTSSANTGRVRMWMGTTAAVPMSTTAAGMLYTADAAAGSYDQGNTDRDRLIAISFQYTESKLLQ
ncbi:MAG: type II secretion system protein [Rhodocyclaceae bacterium]|nr:type II secretion system protein [Rhodocyclaceae bacterium]